jgi:hypothetical protein
MRELHDWHEAKRDAPRHVRDSVVDVHPKHAADPPRFQVLRDAQVRIAETLRYRNAVQEYEAKHAAGHLKPQEAKPEHAPPENRDKPTSKLAKKWDSPESQQEERRRPERSWLPRADAVKAISDFGILATTIAVALGDAAARWDAVAAGAATAVVSNVAWANRRWKEKHGDRPED